VVNYFTGVGQLDFHQRGSRLVRITAVGWLQDRIRFGWDGLRRRRLTTPVVGAAPVGWAIALGVWYTRVYHRRLIVTGVDGFSPTVGWYTRVYRGLTHGKSTPAGISLDSSWWSTVYHGAYAPLATVGVAFPGATPYEVDGVHQSPLGGVSPVEWSAVVTQLLGHHPGGLIPAGLFWSRLGRVQTVFQVSPLQRVLLG
jgi:hypothetical protein